MEGGFRQIKEASCRGDAQRSTSSNITHACIRIQLACARSLSHLHAPPVCLSNAPIPSFLSRRVLYLKLPHTVALFGLSFSQRKNNKHLDCLLFFSLPFRSFLLFLPLFFPHLPFHLPSFTALLSLTPPVSLNNLNVASPHTCCFFFYSAV